MLKILGSMRFEVLPGPFSHQELTPRSSRERSGIEGAPCERQEHGPSHWDFPPTEPLSNTQRQATKEF